MEDENNLEKLMESVASRAALKTAGAMHHMQTSVTPTGKPTNSMNGDKEFSKRLLKWCLWFLGALCVASLLSWFIRGDWPKEIVKYFTWPFIAGFTGITGYMIKSGCENKAKIQNRKDGGGA